MTARDPNSAADFIIKSAKPYAQAKAQRCFLEEHRKTLKALLMNESTGKTVSDREQYAYSHQKYQELLMEFKNAILEEETLRVQIKGAELTIELWKAETFSNAKQDRTLR